MYSCPVSTSGDGIFRALRIPPGRYELMFTPRGGAAMRRQGVEIHAGEVLSIEVHLTVAEKEHGLCSAADSRRGDERCEL